MPVIRVKDETLARMGKLRCRDDERPEEVLIRALDALDRERAQAKA